MSNDLFLSGGGEPVLQAQNQVTNEPTGFPTSSRNNTTISFNDITQEFSIQPISGTFDYYIRGVKFTSFGATITVPNTTDLYLFYFDNTGTLQYQVGFDASILNNNAFIATVYWNATGGQYFITDERHGLTMDWATHQHLHEAFGTRYYSGFNIGFTLGDGSLNAHAEISLQGGVIADEDLITEIVDSPTPANYFEQTLSPVALVDCLSVRNNEWVSEGIQNAPIVNTGTGRMAYDIPINLQEATDNYFVAVWIFAVPFLSNPVISILGTREDAALEDAKVNNNYESIDWSSFPAKEFKILYRLIYQTSDSYANSYKARIVDVLDLRTSVDSKLSIDTVIPVTNHAALTGLLVDDHPQYHNDTRGDARYLKLSDYIFRNEFDYKDIPNFLIENFYASTSGTAIPFTAPSTASGGSSSMTAYTLATDMGGVITKRRVGILNLSITNANNSRSGTSTSTSRYRFGIVVPNNSFANSFEVAFSGGLVDFANDPVFIGIGYLSTFVVYPSVSTGLYVRPPRATETATFKVCIMQGGVETIFDSTVPFVNTPSDRYCRIDFYYDSAPDVVYVTITTSTNQNTVTIPNLSGTYAVLSALTFSCGALLARNGSGAVALLRALRIDTFTEYIESNY
jgi:hypothetical protein